MNLYLVRHGEALSSDVNPERPLSDAGIADVEKVAGVLKQSGVSVDTVLHSTKKRAEETARILAEALNPGCNLVETRGLEPDDPVDNILVKILESEGSLMIVGHLPFLRYLAERLIGWPKSRKLPSFKPGSVISLAGSESGWEMTGYFFAGSA